MEHIIERVERVKAGAGCLEHFLLPIIALEQTLFNQAGSLQLHVFVLFLRDLPFNTIDMHNGDDKLNITRSKHLHKCLTIKSIFNYREEHLGCCVLSELILFY
jgi:hypothetical protein